MSNQDDNSPKNPTGLNRRELIQLGAAAGAGTFLAGIPGAEAARTPQVPRRVLGKTGKKIPILLFGGAVRLDSVFDHKLAEAMRYGVNYFDAARMYGGGRCEANISAYLKRAKNRKKIWLTSKSMLHDPADFKGQLAITLKELNTSYVDMYFLHALKQKRYLNAKMGKMAYQLKRSGKMRHVGFSCHNGNVVELLNEAAKHSWIDAIMFKYNFRSFGDKALNKAIDACARKGIGLIAMKTQGAATSFAGKVKKFKQTGKWTQHQAVLKAVWSDPRITASVSAMKTMGQLRQNIGAAVNKSKLTSLETNELNRYAMATRNVSCDGCDHICNARVNAPVQIGDTMRFLMYHDSYGEPDKARALYRGLPASARNLAGVDFKAASAACPHGLDVGGLMLRAGEVLG